MTFAPEASARPRDRQPGTMRGCASRRRWPIVNISATTLWSTRMFARRAAPNLGQSTTRPMFASVSASACSTWSASSGLVVDKWIVTVELPGSASATCSQPW